MTDQGLRLRDAALTLGQTPLFAPLTLTVAPGSVTTIMGPSGSGKSTLLSALCGTLDPAFAFTGAVSLNGRALNDVPAEARRVGILFQDDLLFPHMSVGDNLAFGLPAGLTRAERDHDIDAALEACGLQGFGGRDPATLSGGQRARIACMRALLARPEALLLDEPFSKLDAGLRDRFRRFVFDHAIRERLPTLLVTHDPDDARAAGGEIVELRTGQID